MANPACFRLRAVVQRAAVYRERLASAAETLFNATPGSKKWQEAEGTLYHDFGRAAIPGVQGRDWPFHRAFVIQGGETVYTESLADSAKRERALAETLLEYLEDL